MDNITITKIEIDEDGFYDIEMCFVSEKAKVNCRLFINEEEINKLKKNIKSMYNFNLKNFDFNYEAIGLSDNINLKFRLNDNGHVSINYDISNEDEKFNSTINVDLETLNSFIQKIN